MSSSIRRRAAAATVALLATAGLVGFAPSADAAAPAPTSSIVAVNKTGNRVLVIRPDGRVERNKPIAGTNGELIRAIDVRPNGGGVYGVSTNHLYLIDPVTGQATQIGGDFAIPLTGDFIGMDFNPSVDRIRIVTSSGQDLRLNQTVTGSTTPTVDGNGGSTTPVDGIQGDGDLMYAGDDPQAGTWPFVVAAGYTNNAPTTGGPTQLYVLDAGSRTLDLQGRSTPTVVSPNTGTLFTVASVPAITPGAGLDIVNEGGVNTGYLSLPEGTNTKILVLDLATGATSRVLKIDEKLGDFAVLINTPV